MNDQEFDLMAFLHNQNAINPLQSFDPSGAQGGSVSLPGVNTPQGMNGWQKFGIGANALTGLAGAYSAYKQLGLMKNQLQFQKSLANRNLSNSATMQNRDLKNRAIMAAQMTTGADYGTDKMVGAADRMYRPVNGAPIGLAAPAQRSLREEITGTS